MDGTLLDLHFDTHFWLEHLPRRYAQIHNTDLTQTRHTLMAMLQSNRGTLQWYCADYWSERLGVDIAALKAEDVSRIGYRPYAELFLQLLKRSGKRVVLVTNDHRHSLCVKLAQTSLGEYLDAVIVSHDFGAAKEEQAFWHAMQGVEPFDPKRSLFIDDTADVLASAQRYGIANLCYIAQPDSQRERVLDERFAALHCFSTLNQALQGISSE